MYSDTFYTDLNNGMFWCIPTSIEMHPKSTTYQVADMESHIIPVEIPATMIASAFVIVLN